MKVQLADIHFDYSIYPRKAISQNHVNSLVAAMEVGISVPPVVLWRDGLRPTDGFHRITATQKLGLEEIEAELVDYASAEEALADSVRRNADHGLRLTQFDLRTVIARLSEAGYDRERVSEIARIPIEGIEKIIADCAKTEDVERWPGS